jgi:hypothetical protein
MTVEHVVFLLEEPSLEAALAELLPRMLGNITFELHQFGGKGRLLTRLPDRLAGYASWLPATHRIVVVLDRDADDCKQLKQALTDIAKRAGLKPKAGVGTWQVAYRIAIEELEAWFFGDWMAVQAAYSRVKATVPQKAGYRDPDQIKGGTWEALERVLQDAGYFPGGLAKIELARAVSSQMEPARNVSGSFGALRSLLASL